MALFIKNFLLVKKEAIMLLFCLFSVFLVSCPGFLTLVICEGLIATTAAVVGQLWYYYWTAIKRFSTYCHHNTVQDHIDRIVGVDPCLHRDKRCWHSMRNCGPKRHWDKYNRMSFESTNPIDLKLENKVDISKKKFRHARQRPLESNWNIIFCFAFVQYTFVLLKIYILALKFKFTF